MAEITLEELRKESVEDKKHKILEIYFLLDHQGISFDKLYYWLIDFARDSLKLKISKISDTYNASFASGLFGDLSYRTFANLISNLRNIGELINVLTKSIISIINEYQLLYTVYKSYLDLKSNDEKKAYAAYKYLKQRWIDYVDPTINPSAPLRNISRTFPSAYAGFFRYEILSEIEKLKNKGIIGEALYNYIKNDKSLQIDSEETKNVLNEVVRGVISSRLSNFYSWLEYHYNEVIHRINILKGYLKHELNSLVYYTEIIKPYFKIAKKSIITGEETPDIVNIFNVTVIDLSLILTDAEKKIKEWDKTKNDPIEKTYIPVYEINIKGRAIPQSQDYGKYYLFSGRLEINIYGYILEKSEYNSLKLDKLSKDFTLATGLTDEYISNIKELLLDVYIFDIIKNDKKLLELVASKSNKKPDEINTIYDIKWTKELLQELMKDNRISEALGSLYWIEKYFPSEKNEEMKKREEEKKEESKKVSVFPNPLELIMSFITTFGYNLELISKNLQRKEIERQSEKEKSDFLMSSARKIWTIYNSMKKTFGLLSY